MNGCFIVDKNPHEEFDIKCDLHPDIAKDEIPSEQRELYSSIETVNNTIKSLINTEKCDKEKYFIKLLSLSQAGLVGDTAQPNLALQSLEKLKEEILICEGIRIKNSYMIKLGIYALCLIILAILLWTTIYSFFEKNIQMYSLVWIGSMVGAWLSFGARKFEIHFSELSVIEKDMMSPCIRLIFTGIASIIFFLFLNSGIVKIDVGSLSTSNIANNYELQVIIGIICGLTESKLGLKLYNKADSMTDATNT